MKRTCWDTCATDSIIKSGLKDTEASISSSQLVSRVTQHKNKADNKIIGNSMHNFVARRYKP